MATDPSVQKEQPCKGFTQRGGTYLKLLQSRLKNPKYLHMHSESKTSGMRHACSQQT